MSRSRSIRSAVPRALVVVGALGSVLLGMAGTAMADPAGLVQPGSADPASSGSVSAGPVVAGVSVATFVWALVGFSVLVLGFIAASRSGRRVSAGRPGPAVAALRSYQPATSETQGDPASAAVIV